MNVIWLCLISVEVQATAFLFVVSTKNGCKILLQILVYKISLTERVNLYGSEITTYPPLVSLLFEPKNIIMLQYFPFFLRQNKSSVQT